MMAAFTFNFGGEATPAAAEPPAAVTPCTVIPFAAVDLSRYRIAEVALASGGTLKHCTPTAVPESALSPVLARTDVEPGVYEGVCFCSGRVLLCWCRAPLPCIHVVCVVTRAGGFKLWECAWDLVRYLDASADALSAWMGRDVLEVRFCRQLLRQVCSSEEVL